MTAAGLLMSCKATPKISIRDGRGHPLPPVATLPARQEGPHWVQRHPCSRWQRWTPWPAQGLCRPVQTRILMTTLKSTFRVATSSQGVTKQERFPSWEAPSQTPGFSAAFAPMQYQVRHSESWTGQHPSVGETDSSQSTTHSCPSTRDNWPVSP